MKGIVVAAGVGMRMRPLTEEIPKCMLRVAGRSLIDHTIANMRRIGCSEIVVVVGYKKETVRVGDVTFVENRDYARNNILHSFMTARDHLKCPVVCSYSDIWVEPTVYEALMAHDGDIVAAVDDDWRPYYQGRTQHPPSEAENALIGQDGRLRVFGKGLAEAPACTGRWGEFVGLWKMSAAGADIMRHQFEELHGCLGPDEPFQRARAWRNAYITDMFQDLSDRGQPIHGAVVARGWAELDTLEDFERLEAIAPRQRLWTICKSSSGT